MKLHIDTDELKQFFEIFKNLEDNDKWAGDIELEIISSDSFKCYLCLDEIKNDEIIDEGKYQHYIEQFNVMFAIDDNVHETEYVFQRNAIRTGSYYTDYFIQYDNQIVLQKCNELIPEKVIPEHYEIVLKEVNL